MREALREVFRTISSERLRQRGNATRGVLTRQRDGIEITYQIVRARRVVTEITGRGSIRRLGLFTVCGPRKVVRRLERRLAPTLTNQR